MHYGVRAFYEVLESGLGSRRKRSRGGGHRSGSVGLNDSLDPVTISADVSVNARLFLGAAGDVTP